MKVRVLINHQDEFRRVHLVNDVLEIDEKVFDKRLHSEDVTNKQKATKSSRKPRTKKTEPSAGDTDA